MRLSLPLSASLGLLALTAGCAGAGQPGLETVHQPVVSQADYALDLALLGEPKKRAGEAAERALRTYNQSLTDRLGVGVNANGVIFDLKTGQDTVPVEPEIEAKKDAQEI